MTDTKYINVVSGKGGTGKTLLCTILAELLGNQNVNVLVVDMDIFVRGLTALLYFHKGESLMLTEESELTISDIFYRNERKSMKEGRLAIHRYRSFDICPAVSRINQLFNHERELIFDVEHNHMSFKRVIDFIPQGRYDYVLLDCRAGYDSLVSAIHESADMTICVQEDDDISNVTASNLVRQLERDSSRKPIFSLINKARNINDFNDLENKQKQGLTSIGYIPFDMDVMNSFGEKSFWDDISKSLYKSAVAEAWNKLCFKADLKHNLKYRRNSPLLSDKVESFFGIIGLRQRVVSILGLFITVIGATYSFLGRDIFYYIRERPDMLISLLSIFIGLVLFLFGFLSNKKLRKGSR
jgi:septum site-determining protein MinD